MRFLHGESPQPGKSATREYKSWGSAKSRCYRVNDKKFRYYGGRGIVMADEWLHDYPAFLRDMGRCPDGLTLDRIDVNGHYAPGNCRWADHLTQRNNRRDSGKTHCKRGHVIDGVVRRHGVGGYRFCRECQRDNELRHRARKRPCAAC